MRKRWNIIRQWVWRLSKVALAVVVIASVIYWVRFAPIPVTQHQVEQSEIVAEVMGTGTLEAHVKATVSSKIAGRIAAVLVDQGDRVQRGQLLVRLDDEELKQQVEIARANRETALAAISRLEADKERATAVAQRARAHHLRVQGLVERRIVTKEEVDQSTESLAIAEAGLSRAEAAIIEGQKELVAAEKTLAYQQARLADTKIMAPVAGLIVRRQRDLGDVVVPGSSILTLISTDELWITAWVDETEMAKLHEKQTVRVVFRSEANRRFSGTVVRLGREADRETREFIVDVRVLKLPENWAVGQRAEVYIETDRKASVVLLPAEYVVRREGHPGVFVNRNGLAEWRPLTLGLRSRDMVEATNGLESGESVIRPTDPKNSLSSGQRIVMP